ncbi:NADP-dependent oxidoreductase [Methylopila jiangsuensis]|uniref:NADP-dependent oxidoreductase n=1 Tax=Methylopila jiangsuensis TaxID=586230 RepID=A0A9W6N4V0_9HYPH|nr:aldo/keto reductase [Methylopila jiangsuensis]MDR6284917.1 aryl-alcohol dehydrogenase-like predicted oxidoreductase [Methylopila jiangsuensis]GLK77695.1 NADP-dependent oxidoreductase [Methylopila jiangsuensis]
MERRPLGRTGLDVSVVCLGTMTFGEQNSEAEGHAQLDRAADAGINFLDAAELYPIPPKPETQGRTEEIVGSWLARGANRDRMIVATKAVGRTVMDWFRKDGATGELSRAQLREAVEGSLRRLRTECIDLYQLHWPDREVSQFGSNPTVFRPVTGPEIAIHETLEALGELVREGKIRHVGLSNESAWGTMTFLRESEARGLPRVASLQNAYSLLNRTYETGLAEISLRENVSLLGYSPLAQGYLTGKYADGAQPAGARKTLFDRLQRYETTGAEGAIAAYLDLAGEIGWSPTHLALQFAATRSFMTSVIIGATSLEQLDHDLAAFERPWSAEIESKVDAIHRLRTNPCP